MPASSGPRRDLYHPSIPTGACHDRHHDVRRARGRGRHVPAHGRAQRLLRGTGPRWERPALLGLLALTAFLYLINLSRNGWANDFYAAAVEAGTKSWKAFFFGSFDSSSFITVDKTPASLWVMELSGRIFGVNSWSVLVPQALEGVACVGVLYAAVRRWFGPAAGLIAGLTLALTPVAALMFRFNNPDALLVLLLTAAAYMMVRALENGRSRWLVFAGLLLGFAFLAKMMQAFLVVPGFAVAYLWAGPPKLGERIWQVLLAGAAIIVGGGWWVAIAELVPAADRPYFGGSTNNNILQLAIGYNGLGRLTGSETGSIGGRARRGRRLRRRDRHHPAVLLGVRRPDQLAAPGRPDLPRGHAVGVPPGRPHRPDPRRGPAVGRLAAVHRPRVQLHERHHPPVLHGRPRTGDRRPRQRGRDGAVGAAAGVVRPPGGHGGRRGDGLVGLRAAQPVGVVAPVAPLGHHPGRCRRGGVDPGRPPAGRAGRVPPGRPGGRPRRAAAARAGGRSGGGRAGGGARRAGRVRHRRGGDHAHRVDPECGTADHGGPWWPRRGGRRNRRPRDRDARRDRDRHGRRAARAGGRFHRDEAVPPGPDGTGSAGGAARADRRLDRDRDRHRRIPGRLGWADRRDGGTAGPGGPAGSAGTPR